MNNHFDWAKAGEIIGTRFLQDKQDASNAGICNVSLLKIEDARFIRIQYPPSIRLMTGEREEAVEVVMKIPGVLCSKILPPLKRIPGRAGASQVRNLRQQVKVTGGGQLSFNAALDKVMSLFETFKQHVGASKVLPYDNIPFEGERTLESHARYFTDRDLVPYEKNESFLPGVDPHQVLRRIQPDSFIHAQDNRVEYCTEELSASGAILVQPCDPSVFHVGDIVDMVFSFVGIPVKDGMYKVILNLRGLTLVNADLRKESVNAELRGDCAPAAYVTAPKRRRLYLDAPTSGPVVENDTATTADKDCRGGAPTDQLTVTALGKERGMQDVAEKMQRMEVDRH
ncbi:hypothetical protein EST38_g11793 [Candolleomyces aberdarensis]|uniref:Uncharacterized protein n=1 Tax=Candolleomyces aberdarensis TaxID=2316362 RepID=A0A4Q2D6A7_9AGAR|nr:hypothetical protein EST38_g11793 [Candolleomyces aberdarensis]